MNYKIAFVTLFVLNITLFAEAASPPPNTSTPSSDYANKLNQQMQQVIDKAKTPQSSSLPSHEELKKTIYDLCQDQMIKGMKDAMGADVVNSQGKMKLTEDPVVMSQMEAMSNSTCKCATPLMVADIENAIKVPNDKYTQEYFQHAFTQAIAGCIKDDLM
jgi:hypothetical protein